MQAYRKSCNYPSRVSEIMLTPGTNVWHPAKTYGLCWTMKKWKPHCWRERATSRVHQCPVNNINLCYSREHAVRSTIPPASLEKTALVCDGTGWALVLSYHPGKSFLYLGNRLSKESVPLSAAADLSHSTKTLLQHFLQAISFHSSSCPTCSEVHGCKFHSVLRNLICRVWPQYFLSLQDF